MDPSTRRVFALGTFLLIAVVAAFLWQSKASYSDVELGQGADPLGFDHEGPRRDVRNPLSTLEIPEGNTPGPNIQKQPDLESAARLYTGPIHFEGEVSDNADSEIPIANAKVSLFADFDDGSLVFLVSTTTNQEGEFSVTTLALAGYRECAINKTMLRCMATADGFIPDWEWGSITTRTTNSVMIGLQRGQGVRGRLVDHRGQIVSNGTVTALQWSESQGYYDDLNSAKVLPDGSFGLSIDVEGPVILEFNTPQGAARFPDVSPRNDTVVDLGEIVVSELGVIEGVMVDKVGSPVPFLPFYISLVDYDDKTPYEEPGLEEGRVHTDKQGKFRVIGLKVGRRYYFSYAGSLGQSDNHMATTRDLRLVNTESRLLVHVEDENGQPIRGVDLQLLVERKDPRNKIFYQTKDRMFTMSTKAYAVFDLALDENYALRASLNNQATYYAVDRPVPKPVVGTQMMKIVMPTAPAERWLELRVLQAKNGRTTDFSAQLLSARTEEPAQIFTFGKGGRERIRVAPGKWILEVFPRRRDGWRTRAPSFAVGHRETIDVPTTGTIRKDIHLRIGGRLAIRAARLNENVTNGPITMVAVARSNGANHLFRFAACRSRGREDFASLGNNWKWYRQAFLPGVYDIEFSSPWHQTIRRTVTVESNKMTLVTIILENKEK